MKQRPRIYYSASQKALMWERWKQGWTPHEIGTLFDRSHSSIHGIISETGGIRPPERTRSRLSLALQEREEISLRLAVGQSIRLIAAQIERAPSTVNREIERNGAVPPKVVKGEPIGPSPLPKRRLVPQQHQQGNQPSP